MCTRAGIEDITLVHSYYLEDKRKRKTHRKKKRKKERKER